MRKQLWDAAAAAFVNMEKQEITPWEAALAGASPYTPFYKAKKNKYSQKYSHFMEYVNRYIIVHKDSGVPKHILLPQFSYFQPQNFAEPDIQQFLDTLPDWPELGFKIAPQPYKTLNFYNPVAVALLYYVETGVKVHPEYVESQLKAKPRVHPVRTKINYCQKPEDEEEYLYHCSQLGNKNST